MIRYPVGAPEDQFIVSATQNGTETVFEVFDRARDLMLTAYANENRTSIALSAGPNHPGILRSYRGKKPLMVGVSDLVIMEGLKVIAAANLKNPAP